MLQGRNLFPSLNYISFKNHDTDMRRRAAATCIGSLTSSFLVCSGFVLRWSFLTPRSLGEISPCYYQGTFPKTLWLYLRIGSSLFPSQLLRLLFRLCSLKLRAATILFLHMSIQRFCLPPCLICRVLYLTARFAKSIGLTNHNRVVKKSFKYTATCLKTCTQTFVVDVCCYGAENE